MLMAVPARKLRYPQPEVREIDHLGGRSLGDQLFSTFSGARGSAQNTRSTHRPPVIPSIETSVGSQTRIAETLRISCRPPIAVSSAISARGWRRACEPTRSRYSDAPRIRSSLCRHLSPPGRGPRRRVSKSDLEKSALEKSTAPGPERRMRGTGTRLRRMAARRWRSGGVRSLIGHISGARRGQFRDMPDLRHYGIWECEAAASFAPDFHRLFGR
jgi:hypothetical protein